MRPIIFLLLAVLVLLACNENTIVEPKIAEVEVQFDLQYGFENKHVSIMVDSTNHFSALLSESVPLSGPLAIFNTKLEKGEHEIIIFCSSLENINERILDTSKINIGESLKYFIGISLFGDSVKVHIQDSSYFYI